jgi:FSR family fosmidomycin resistance protein-like MFS transporter
MFKGRFKGEWFRSAWRIRAAQRALSITTLFLLIEFYDELHYGIQTAVLPSLRADLGLTYAQVGLLLGLPGVINTLIEPALMLLGDTSLRKRLIVGGGLVLAAAVLIIASAETFPAVLLAFIISFPASGAFVTLSQATLMDLHPGRQAQMMARWTAAGSLANLVGPLLVVAGFALGLGWRWAYLGLAVLDLGLTLCAWAAPHPARPNSTADQPEGGASDYQRLLPELGLALRNLDLMRWFILLEFADLLMDVFTSYVVLYFSDVVGLSPAQTGLVLSGLMITSLVTDLLLIPLLDRIPGRRIVRLSAAFALILFPAFLVVPWAWAKIGLGFAVRASTIGWYAVLQGEAYAALPERSGTVMALNSLAGLAGGALVWLVGWSAEIAGLSTAMWLLLLGPLALVLFMPGTQRQIA